MPPLFPPEGLPVHARIERLSAVESLLATGSARFIEIGLALDEIRSGGLYRVSHARFEVYCLERWGLSRQRVSQLVTAARLAVTLSEGAPAPARESHVRPLGLLPPERRREAWERALRASGGKLTARSVREVVEAMLRPAATRAGATGSKRSPSARRSGPRSTAVPERGPKVQGAISGR